MSYLSEIDGLLVTSAELLAYNGTVVMTTPEYIQFEKKIENFANKYSLQSTRSWQNISKYLLKRQNQFLTNREIREVIISLMGLRVRNVNVSSEEQTLVPIYKNKKIFISHSSDNEKEITSFVTQILRLGCGFQTDDIVYTSIESTGIKTGDDIRNYLKEKIKECDYVFFMISKNYIESTICLNEMGAAWVLDKKVKPFLFPNLNYTNLGWLYEISKGSSLDNEFALDHLRDELLEEYKLIQKPQTADWTVQKKEFLKTLK